MEYPKEYPQFGNDGNMCLHNAIDLANGDENLVDDAVMKATVDITPFERRRMLRRNFPSIVRECILENKRKATLESVQPFSLVQKRESNWPCEKRKSAVLEEAGYSDSRHYKKRIQEDA